MSSLEDWYIFQLDRLERLKSDYNHIQVLTLKLKSQNLISGIEELAVNTALEAIRNEMQAIEGDLEVYKIVNGEIKMP